MKNMYYLSSYLLLLITITAIATPTITSATKICPTYSTSDSISSTVKRWPEISSVTIFYMNTTAVRLLDSTPVMNCAFAYTKVSIFLSVPNPQVHLLAPNHSLKSRWVSRHVPPFHPRTKIYVSATFSFSNIIPTAFKHSSAQFQHPRTKISIISVWNDVISYSPDESPFSLVAMWKVHQSLMGLRIYKIYVSAQFQQPNGEVIIRKTLLFLYYLPAGVIYRNLFEVMVDAVISAMAALGHESLTVIVAETGWLSSGINASKVDATLMYSEMYLKALFIHPICGSGTPLRKEDALEVYIFELVVKHAKQGIRNWGFVQRNMTNKYSLEFSDGGNA